MLRHAYSWVAGSNLIGILGVCVRSFMWRYLGSCSEGLFGVDKADHLSSESLEVEDADRYDDGRRVLLTSSALSSNSVSCSRKTARWCDM